MLRDIAVNEFSTLRWSFQKDVIKYASQGINKIGLSRDKVSDFGIDAAIDLLYEMKMQVSSVNWAGGFTGSDGSTFVDAVEDAKQAIQFAGYVKADCLVVHSGGRNCHTNRHARRIFEHAIDSLLPVAEDFGVRLAIEPIAGPAGRDWSIFSQIDQAIEMVNQYDSEQLGLVVDLFHCGLSPEAVTLFEANAERIALIQIADRTERMSNKRLLPGQGNVDIQRWLAALNSAGVNCPVELEVYGECNRGTAYGQRLAEFKQFLAQPKIADLSTGVAPSNSEAFRN